MVSKTEQIISQSFRAILADLPNDANIPETEGFRTVLNALAWWLPGIVGEVFPEWNGMTLDAIYPVLARKTADGEVEILGQCLFIDDQTLTPIHLHLQIAPADDEVIWLECQVGEKLEGKPGERGTHGMQVLPYELLYRAQCRLYQFHGNADQIDWVYKVVFGERRP